MVDLPAIARQKSRRCNQGSHSNKQMGKEEKGGNLYVKGIELQFTDIHHVVVAHSLLLWYMVVQVVLLLLLLMLMLLLLLLLLMVRRNTSPSSAVMLRTAKTFRSKIGCILQGLGPHPWGSEAAYPLSRPQTCPLRGGARLDFCKGVPRKLRHGLEIPVCASARKGVGRKM